MKASTIAELVLYGSKHNRDFKKAELTPRENMLIAYRHGTPPILPNIMLDAGIMFARPELERYTGFTRGKDGFGVEWQYQANVNAPMVVSKPLFEDISEWREYFKFPDLDAIDWKAQAEKDLHTNFIAADEKSAARLSKKSNLDGDKLGYFMVLNGMFERMHALMGFENALISLLEDPEASFDFFSAMADYKIAYFRKIAEFYPVDVIAAHDDYGAAGGMLMSPDTWRTLLKPNLKRMVDACHELGIIYEHHSCGFIEPIIPDLVEIGVDALDPLQVVNKNMPEIKQKYQDRLTFVGGIDNVGVADREGVTEAEVVADYHRCVDTLAPGGSYVVFTSAATSDNIPIMLLEHLKYGAKKYYRNI